MKILGVETSCDETTASIVEIDETGGFINPLSNIISSQIKLHAQWGGVVPNLAAREHLKNILPVIEECLKKANCAPKDIDLLAVTRGPGLMPALLVGTSTAKTLSLVWQKPLIGIHHIEGHIYANFIANEISVKSKIQIPNSKKNPNYKLQSASRRTNFKQNQKVESRKSKVESNGIKSPMLCLVVSGGHTQLVLMKKHLDYTIIGETQDDAVGEAFDKVARILGLGYPGGPAVAAEAAKLQITNYKLQTKHKSQNYKLLTNQKLTLPRPMINSKDFNFSFSGLKTAVLYTVKKNPEILQDQNLIAQLCAEFQQAAVDVLIAKTINAAKKYCPKTILLAGGVSANTELQSQMAEKIRNNFPDTAFSFPEKSFQLDNAAMIATAAFFRYQKLTKKDALFSNWKNLKTEANIKLARL